MNELTYDIACLYRNAHVIFNGINQLITDIHINKRLGYHYDTIDLESKNYVIYKSIDITQCKLLLYSPKNVPNEIKIEFGKLIRDSISAKNITKYICSDKDDHLMIGEIILLSVYNNEYFDFVITINTYKLIIDFCRNNSIDIDNLIEFGIAEEIK